MSRNKEPSRMPKTRRWVGDPSRFTARFAAMGETLFTGYDSLESAATVIGLVRDGVSGEHA